MLTVGSLFAGIGGFDLGLERAGMKVIWQSEIDPYASAVLKKHWPHVPNHGDIRTITADRVERPDVLCGGFPCQDISYAGDGAGIDGERSGLWSEYARLIRELRPSFVVVENVAALLKRGMGRVLGDLARIRYSMEWESVSACSVGAAHVRSRVFLVAYPDGVYGRPWVWDSIAQQDGALQTFDGAPRARASFRIRLENPSELYRGADGIPAGMDRNRAIGNAIVPQIAEIIGRAIIKANV